jgi:hypothetical protein
MCPRKLLTLVKGIAKSFSISKLYDRNKYPEGRQEAAALILR